MITDSERDIIVIRRVLTYCDAIDKAVERFGNDFETFKNDVVFINAVSMPIMQIGELTKHLSDEFKASHSDIPWALIRGMRNWFAHDYDKMDISTIWKTVFEDIPVMRKFCEGVLEQNTIIN